MIHDLTISINNETFVIPGDESQKIEQIATVEKDGYCERRISFNTHFSTHIDFPSHMLSGGKTLSDYPLSKFVGECVVIDVENRGFDDVSLDGVREGDFVFFHTNKINKSDYFENTPFISKDLVKKIIEKKVSIIGLDSWSPDDEPYEIHKSLLKSDILIVENMNNLSGLIGKRLDCVVAPLKIENSDGAPCRVIAFDK